MKGCSCATTDCIRSTVAAINAAQQPAFRERIGRLPSLPLTGWHLWTSPDLLLAGRERHRAETRHIAPLTAIRQVVAAIRRWREHTRSRQQLRALDDHMLQDIGLKREDVGFEFPKPLWHWD